MPRLSHCGHRLALLMVYSLLLSSALFCFDLLLCSPALRFRDAPPFSSGRALL
eukprot:m.36844 g.36844  ORF g.36844 m.36844 type:complete len:53 (-) comp5411_c0_seq1:75-233(-)